MSAFPTRIRWIEIDFTPSTQDLALTSYDSADDWLCVRADHQSAGRGRMGRSWHDTPGQNLLLTIAFRPEITGHKLPLLSLLAGLALWKLLTEKFPDSPFFLKWPNDLFIGQTTQENKYSSCSKVGGILIESKKNLLLVGLGLNIFHAPITDQKCACLNDIFPQHENAVRLLSRSFVSFFQAELYEFLKHHSTLSDYQRELLKMALSPLWGRSGKYFPSHMDPEKFIPATARDIDLDTGALLISRDKSSELISVHAGEFKFLEI